MKHLPWFAAFLALAASASALDVSYFAVVKATRYAQPTTGSPTILASNAYSFTAFAVSTNGQVTNITVKPYTLNTNIPLVPDTNRFNWLFEQAFNTQAALDAAFPSSGALATYNVTMRTINDGVRTAGLSYSFFLGGPPPTPTASNLGEGQAIDTTRDFTLRWTPSGGSLDIVQVTVLDAASNAVYASPLPLSSNGLTGASSACVVPAYTLPPGAGLTGHLTFARPHIPDTNSYPGAVGVPALARDTEFSLLTRPAPVQPRLTIEAATLVACQLGFSGESNRVYRLQGSPDLAQWTELFVTNLPGTQGKFTDTHAPSLARRFYRIQIGP